LLRSSHSPRSFLPLSKAGACAWRHMRQEGCVRSGRAGAVGGADDRAGRLAGKTSYAGAAVCCGAGEYAPPGDTLCSACPAGKHPPTHTPGGSSSSNTQYLQTTGKDVESDCIDCAAGKCFRASLCVRELSCVRESSLAPRPPSYPLFAPPLCCHLQARYHVTPNTLHPRPSTPSPPNSGSALTCLYFIRLH
jgi:hypothetical protein